MNCRSKIPGHLSPRDLLLLLVFLPIRAETSSAQEVPIVHVIKVAKGRLDREVRQAAVLAPLEAVPVYTRASGYARTLTLDIGDKVEAGQVLVELEAPELESEVDARKAALATSMARVEKARAQLALKKAFFDLTGDLEKKGGRTIFQLEEARAEHNLAEAEVKLALAEVDEAKARYDLASVTAEYRKVLAPFDGIITRRYVDSGALILDGSRSGAKPVFDVERVDKLRCLVDVPEKDAALLIDSLEKGVLSARIRIQALEREISFTGEQMAGGITRFSRTIHPESHHMRAAIDIDNTDGTLLSGLFVHVTLKAAGMARSEAILIPNTAIRAPRKKQPYVMILDREAGKTTVETRLVKLGVTDGRWSEVLEGDISTGDEIVVRSPGTLLAGQEVIARSPDKGTETAP